MSSSPPFSQSCGVVDMVNQMESLRDVDENNFKKYKVPAHFLPNLLLGDGDFDYSPRVTSCHPSQRHTSEGHTVQTCELHELGARMLYNWIQAGSN